MKLFVDLDDALKAQDEPAATHAALGILAVVCNDIHRIADALESLAATQAKACGMIETQAKQIQEEMDKLKA